MSSEMADLHHRSTSLAAENEALRGHVQHLQDKVARLEDTITVSSFGSCQQLRLLPTFVPKHKFFNLVACHRHRRWLLLTQQKRR